MRYQLNQVTRDLFAEQDPRELLARGLQKAKLGHAKVDEESLVIVHRSLDARNKNALRWVYTLAFDSDETLDLPLAKDYSYTQMTATKKPDLPPVVVGMGPCGLFAALILARGGLSPILLERGKPVDERVRDVEAYWQGGPVDTESNVQYGEGGAGTFSDGKLTSRIGDARVQKVLEEFVRFGADPSILYRNKPHIGTDKLREILPRMRQEILDLGGQILFESRLEDVRIEEGALRGVILADGREIAANHLVLALGHSARDTFAMLRDRGLFMDPKPFSIGLRVEHEQSLLNAAQYGPRHEEAAALAGPADYKLHWRTDEGRGVYSFCMCPGGDIVMAATEPGTIVTNGMSNAARDGHYGNSALLVDVRVDDFAVKDGAADDVLAGAAFQEKYEKLAFELGRGKAPETRFEAYRESTLYQSLPAFAAEGIGQAMTVFGRRLAGFDNPGTRMVGVETRSSSPVRFYRDDSLQSNIGGIYPAGEGAGYAGGITSAAVDGIRVAEKILSRFCV